MSMFEHLKKPTETITGNPIEWWYVETMSNGDNRCLINSCFVCNVTDCADPVNELYYDNEAEAYACMEEYYSRNNVPFPYYSEMRAAEVLAGYTENLQEDCDKTSSQIMEFI